MKKPTSSASGIHVERVLCLGSRSKTHQRNLMRHKLVWVE
jgi:hypothetical protein